MNTSMEQAITLPTVPKPSNRLRLNDWDIDRLVRHQQSTIPRDVLIRHVRLDNGRHAMNIDANAPNLGTISDLPMELQRAIVLNMDIQTLLVWRRVNKRAMHLVAEMSEWKKVLPTSLEHLTR